MVRELHFVARKTAVGQHISSVTILCFCLPFNLSFWCGRPSNDTWLLIGSVSYWMACAMCVLRLKFIFDSRLSNWRQFEFYFPIQFRTSSNAAANGKCIADWLMSSESKTWPLLRCSVCNSCVGDNCKCNKIANLHIRKKHVENYNNL